MKDFEFSNQQVDFVSSFLQGHMARYGVSSMAPDECASLLDESGLLVKGQHPKPGFRFRQMLRDGRDGKINKVDGAEQARPRTSWTIRKVDYS